MFGLAPELRTKVESHDSKFYDIIKKALNVKKEDVLIVTDYGREEHKLAAMLGYGYYYAAKKKGLNVNLIFQEVKKGYRQADNQVIQALRRLEHSNVVILALSNKLGRVGEENSFRSFCSEQGHRFISATGLGDVKVSHYDLFLEAMSVNYSRMNKVGMGIKKQWDFGKEIRVTTPGGTDVTFDVRGMEAISNVGEYHEFGKGGNMPAGEVYIAPLGMHGVHGRVVVDGSIKTEDGAILVDEPVTFFIETGKVVRMEGKHADLIERTFQRFEERSEHPQRVRLVGELGIGINPGAVLIGSMIMDEKVLGTGHFAIGGNHWFGGAIKSIFHGDYVFKSPTFYVDGKKMEM